MSIFTLQDILAAKERRSAMRAGMLDAHHGVYLTLALNIPGNEKLSPRIRTLFTYAVGRVSEVLRILAMSSVEENTGPYAVFAVADAAQLAKEAAVAIEAGASYGRLLDLDVYDAHGVPVSIRSRDSGRACFLCSRPAAVCMRERNHGPLEIAGAVDAMFADFFADMSRNISPGAEVCAALGIEALLFEVAASPAPGLVDPLHNGSHGDMDFFTFQKSTAALAHGMCRCAEAGLRHEESPSTLLPVLRCIGIETERRMFRATEGVNTQKGALFSMGLVLGASGLLLRNGEALAPENISRMLRLMTAGLVAREMGAIAPVTAGGEAYAKYGLAGIRGEMERGLPSVLNIGLPTVKKALAKGDDCNRALIRALIALIAEVDDTTILYRSNSLDVLRDVQNKARDLLASGRLDGEDWQKAVWEFDAALVHKNISPGGSADLLAISWYLHRIATLRGGGI